MTEVTTTKTTTRTDHKTPYTVENGEAELGWLNRLRVRLGLDESPSIREVLLNALVSDDESKAAFTAQERSMLLNILRFGALRVDDVMVPRADVIAIDEQATLAELLLLFEKAGHSRLPVYRETLDDPSGMVHIKDLISWMANQAIGQQGVREKKNGPNTDLQPNGSERYQIDLKSVDLSLKIIATKIKRDVLFVPPSMPVFDLLLRMQSTRVHLALVVDEYGGTDGLVSIEDLVEEIVGEIEDEHDVDEGPMLSDHPTLGLVASARTPISELEEWLNISLNLPDRDDDEVDTLGGLVFSIVGRVPVRGELVPHPSGVEFEVLDADPRRIKKLKINFNNTPDHDGKPD